MGAAAAAVVSAMPTAASIFTTAENDAPADDDATSSALAEAPSDAQPLIAHVTDLRSGQISVFMGEREYTMSDPGLARRLFGATK